MDDGDISEDALLGGTVRLLQPRRGHRAGTDAVLLARLSEAKPGETIVDLGAASGAVGLILARTMPEARLTFVEREPALVDLCRRNIALNGFDGRAEAVEADAFALRGSGLAQGLVDLVVTNPPFFEDDGGIRHSPDRHRRAAHHMEGGRLADWIAGAAWLLRPRGRLALVHRADCLNICLAALVPRFGSVALRAVHARGSETAHRIVITAIAGGRAPLRIMPPLMLHAADGSFNAEAARLHAAP